MTVTPSLSVVCFTNDPPHRVAAALSRVRDLASEVIVAVDDRVDPDTLGPLIEVADRVVRAEFVPPLEANLAWLHDQASCEWVLRLDGDDVVSDALVARLATPGWDLGITHAYVSYRWLWPDPHHALTQPPWWPDPALRLIRNIPGIARFPHGAHQPPVVAGDMRFLDEPIFHLDLLLADQEARAAKAERYERDASGHRTDQGWSVNTTYYLPELLRKPPITGGLDPVDAAAVDSVLQAAPPTGREQVGLLEHVRFVDRTSPPPRDGDITLRAIANVPVGAVTGRTYTVTVGLTNHGDRTLRPDEASPTALTSVLLDEDGEQIAHEQTTPLPCPAAPGDEILVRIPIPYFPDTGSAILRVEAIQEHSGLRHDAVLDIPVEMQWGRKVLLSTGISPHRHLGDDLITRAIVLAITQDLPDVVPVVLAHPVEDQGERFGCQTIPSPASARPATVPSGVHADQWAADLVRDAERIAGGLEPLDEDNALLIQPFVAASALVIAPGGGFASRFGDEVIAPRALEVRVADAVGLPVVIEGAHLGPLDRRIDRRNVVRAFRTARRLTARDVDTAKTLLDLGAAEHAPRLVPDPATAMLDRGRRLANDDRRALLTGLDVDPDGPHALLSLRGGVDGPAQLETVRAALEQLPEAYPVLHLPHQSDPNHPDAAVVADDPWLSRRCVQLSEDLDDYLIAALIGSASLAIGSRFHLTVLARWAGIPALALVHDEYDAGRYVVLDADAGLRMVLDTDRAAAAQAVQDLHALGRSEPREPWDGAEFAYELSGILPVEPHLA